MNTELIAELKAASMEGAIIDRAADALQAAQAEIARWTIQRDANKRMRDQHFAELKNLRERLAALEKQEPVQWMTANGLSCNKYRHEPYYVVPLYAAPVATAQPADPQTVYDIVTAAQASQARCQYCDGTGDVHTPTGEWRGECNQCDANKPAPIDVKGFGKIAGTFGAVEKWPVLGDEAQPSQATTEDRFTPPFSNCKFRMCDLPGQCRGEGKCHHPVDQPSQARELSEAIENLIEATEGLMTWQVKNVKVWHNGAYDTAKMRVEQLRAAINAKEQQS